MPPKAITPRKGRRRPMVWGSFWDGAWGLSTGESRKRKVKKRKGSIKPDDKRETTASGRTVLGRGREREKEKKLRLEMRGYSK